MAWMAWLFVHVYYLISFRSKLVVPANWMYRLVTKQGGTRLIIRPFVRADDHAAQDLRRRQLQP
jgi:NADH dehydrogenase